LLDFWCQQHCHQAYDKNGDWGASGKPNLQLLTAFKQDEYFQLPPPKSTGKEYFSAAWLQQKLSTFANINPADVQATLCQLSADSIAEAINQYAPNTQQTLVCGGGAHNQQLLKLLAENLNSPLNSTADCGINPDHVEAIAFAWLARQTINNLPGNLPMATGARSPVILGGIYLGKTAN
jgi:anhydro-N-acetylmuramic acid kinase